MLAGGESKLIVSRHREVVVDHHRSLDAVDVEVNDVASCSIRRLGVEERFDSFLSFCKGAQHGQKVTVSKLALIDVVRINAMIENTSFGVDLACAFPLEILNSVVSRVVSRVDD